MTMQNDSSPDERRGGSSASDAQADLNCPGRHLAQKPYLRKPAGPEAEYGRLIHAVLADNDNFATTKLTLEQRETFDRCRDIEKRLCLEVFPDQGSAHPVKVFREIRFWAKVDGKFEHSAKPDLVMRSGPRGLICEYKTLPGDVPDAPDNLQLRDQVVLAAGHLLLDEVTVAVIQPWVTMKPVVTVYTKADIKRAEVELFDRVRRSNDPKAPRYAGEVQCEYCRAKQGCLEYHRFAGSMLPSMLSVLDVPVSAWTPQQRAVFCQNRGIAQKWLDENWDAMKEGAAADPAFVDGWELTPGNEVETIVDPASVWNRFAALGGKVNQFMGCVKVGKTKLREAVNSLTGARGKALDAAMVTLTDGLTETTRNAPSLKPKKENGK